VNKSPPIEELKAIAHATRFSILGALSQGEHNVGEIEKATGIAQPFLSQQLAVLRGAGLVETRKESKLVFYSLDQERLGGLADMISELADSPAKKKSDGKKALAGAANFARLTG